MDTLNRQMVTMPVLGEREIMSPPIGRRPAIVHVKALDLGITAKPLLVDLPV
jgi:hypothetical protein